MGENKEYVSRSDELGNIHISEEVLAGIAAAAALEVEGVSGLAANLGSDIAELLGKKNLAKGVRVQMEDEKVTVDLSILMAYGHTIPEVGRAVQDGVKNAVESMTGLEIARGRRHLPPGGQGIIRITWNPWRRRKAPPPVCHKTRAESNTPETGRGSSRGQRPASSGIECPECLAWQGVQRAQRGLFRRAAVEKYWHFSGCQKSPWTFLTA